MDRRLHREARFIVEVHIAADWPCFCFRNALVDVDMAIPQNTSMAMELVDASAESSRPIRYDRTKLLRLFGIVSPLAVSHCRLLLLYSLSFCFIHWYDRVSPHFGVRRAICISATRRHFVRLLLDRLK